ncbi:MAG: carboxypeptidase regulatory-like domain-containing protein [Bacteroidia bacterium]|jgi:hypothetical protein
MKNKLKQLLGAIAFLVLTAIGIAQNTTGEIKGLVTDDQHNPAIGAEIKALQGGVLIKNAIADIDGKYTLKPLQPGQYEVLISFTGFKTNRYIKVSVEVEEASYLDSEMEINTLIGFDVVADKPWEKSIVDVSYVTMHKLSLEQLNQMAVSKGDVKGMIANISSDIIVTDNGEIFSRGSRAGSSKYYVDGDVLPFGTEVTGMAIQNLSVITGGIPAQYGDGTGAVIVVNTRDYFSGIAEKNISNSKFKSKMEQEKKDAEFEAQKKKREAEIEAEKKAKAAIILNTKTN